MSIRYALISLAAVTLTSAANAQTFQTSCKATMGDYSALTTGMTYAEAVAVIGCDGAELSRSDMAGYSTVMVAWDGQGMMGSSMNAMFQNDQLVSKAQMGLSD